MALRQRPGDEPQVLSGKEAVAKREKVVHRSIMRAAMRRVQKCFANGAPHSLTSTNARARLCQNPLIKIQVFSNHLFGRKMLFHVVANCCGIELEVAQTLGHNRDGTTDVP